MVGTPVAEKEPRDGMPLPQDLLREGHALVAALGSGELKILARREVAGMRGHEIEEVGFVSGVAEAAEVIDTGFRELHGLETQNGYGDLSFIAHAAKAGGVFRPGIDLKAGAGLLREVSGMVVAGGEFQIHSRDFKLLGGIPDAQVRETDFAVDHGEVQFPCEFYFLPLQVSVVAGLRLSQPPVELLLQLVVEL